jgi:hypothetical protein
MRYLLIGLGALLGLVVLIIGGQIVASETGEVVVLETTASSGPERTRLWVVELDGVQYLRGEPGTGWCERLTADPAVALERAGRLSDYRAEIRHERVAEVNRLMREKYGWRDVYISWLLGSREDALAVALVPRS